MQTGKWTQYTNILTYCYRSIYTSLLYYYIRIFLNRLEFIYIFPHLAVSRPSSYIQIGRLDKNAIFPFTQILVGTTSQLCEYQQKYH